MPSRLEANGAGEGFGIAYVEAGAKGLPVVAATSGVHSTRSSTARRACSWIPRIRKRSRAALITLLRDREYAKRMGRAGWERARTLSWARTAAGVEAVLDEVTAG